MLRLPSRELLSHITRQAIPRTTDELFTLVTSYFSAPAGRPGLPALQATLERENWHDRFFGETLPWIVTRASMLHGLTEGLELRHLDSEGVIQLTAGQAASFMANIFLCAMPDQDRAGGRQFPSVHFWNLFMASASQEHAKLACFINYFDRLAHEEDEAWESRPIYFRRVAAPAARKDAEGVWNWAIDDESLRRPLGKVTVEDRLIEDVEGALQADFANSYLGGGVLLQGSVQEEIRFSVWPELVVCVGEGGGRETHVVDSFVCVVDLCRGMVFCSRMRANEAIVITGAEKFSNTTGYSRTLRFAGDCRDPTPRAGLAFSGTGEFAELAARGMAAVERGDILAGTVLTSVVAMDALRFPRLRSEEELSPAGLYRDLLKAWVAFGASGPECSRELFPAVATGNWGCGAFRGNLEVKALIQSIAASLHGRDIHYTTFGERVVEDELPPFAAWTREASVTAGEAWEALLAVAADVLSRMRGKRWKADILKRVREEIIRRRNSTEEEGEGGVGGGGDGGGGGGGDAMSSLVGCIERELDVFRAGDATRPQTRAQIADVLFSRAGGDLNAQQTALSYVLRRTRDPVERTILEDLGGVDDEEEEEGSDGDGAGGSL